MGNVSIVFHEDPIQEKGLAPQYLSWFADVLENCEVLWSDEDGFT